MQNPLVSIVILTLNEPKKVLIDLQNQSYKNFEVILAKEKGIVTAMNIALKKAKGEIFVRVDDDVFLPANWLKELIKPFQDPLVAGVTGPTFVPTVKRQYRDSIRMAENPNWFLRWLFDNDPYKCAGIYKCGSVSYGSNYQEHTSDYPFNPDHLEGTNWAMRTELIRSTGGFDPKFDGVAEWFDTDVERKIVCQGFKLYYNPKAYMYHILAKGTHFNERFEMFGRIKNWLRFHYRHSKFHPKMLVWLLLMIGYAICQRKR